jgi:ElaB/YqjD/DUF883 family membrane-anchored ribosome-binding protein
MPTTASKRTHPYSELMDSIEDLLQRIADLDSPEITKIRAKAKLALAAARSAWQDSTAYAGRQVSETWSRQSEYLRESPWLTLGGAMLLVIGVGAILARSRDNS